MLVILRIATIAVLLVSLVEGNLVDEEFVNVSHLKLSSQHNVSEINSMQLGKRNQSLSSVISVTNDVAALSRSKPTNNVERRLSGGSVHCIFVLQSVVPNDDFWLPERWHVDAGKQSSNIAAVVVLLL